MEDGWLIVTLEGWHQHTEVKTFSERREHPWNAEHALMLLIMCRDEAEIKQAEAVNLTKFWKIALGLVWNDS